MKELVQVCLEFEKKGQEFEWIALATPNRQLKTEDLEILSRNGLKTLNLGIESGSGEVMQMMKKGFNLEQAEDGLRRIFDAGINTQLNIIVGFPGETERHFEETLEFLDRNKQYICGFTSVNACVLMPGSEISRQPEKYGVLFKPGADFQTEWHCDDGNTAEVRAQRLKRTLDWINDNGYEIYSSNDRTRPAETGSKTPSKPLQLMDSRYK